MTIEVACRRRNEAVTVVAAASDRRVRRLMLAFHGPESVRQVQLHMVLLCTAIQDGPLSIGKSIPLYSMWSGIFISPVSI